MKVHEAASLSEVSEFRRYQAQIRSRMITAPTTIPVIAQMVGVVFETRSKASEVSVVASRMLIAYQNSLSNLGTGRNEKAGPRRREPAQSTSLTSQIYRSKSLIHTFSENVLPDHDYVRVHLQLLPSYPQGFRRRALRW